MMRAGGHYSLFVIAKNLYNLIYNPKKTAETSNNEILNGASKIHAVVITIIMHIMKFSGIIKNPCGRKREISNQLCLSLLFAHAALIVIRSIGGGNRGSKGAMAPLNLRLLHRNVIFAIENHFSLAK